MTWTPPDPGYQPPPPPAGPAKLSWRLGHSAWVLAPILSFGCLAAAGFLYVGIRARKPSWWIPGVAYSVVAWVFFILGGEAADGSTMEDVSYGVFFALWAASVVHALIINPSWLRWRAGHRPWYSQPPAPPVAWAPPPPPAPLPPQMHGLVPGPQQYYAGPVDVNTADGPQLATLPGFGPDRIAHVLAVRQARGGFINLHDFAAAAGLAPHELVAVRDRVVVSPPPPAPDRPGPGPTGEGPPGPYGRIVDV
ncbi:ComEA family DNA-binding protein [Paractinoplanes maris]|uniref:ComEA family DNA-binding protein n=1 Tax=Paractinoplanes maris TaxID=1734446 RepID=UPI00201FB760|nr:helix-hairpin-helix domain-containing protein [Actinoplanes maris]